MSTGEKVPIVFFPRFSTIVSTTEYITTPIDMLGFSSYEVQAWRGEISSPSSGLDLKIRMEESADLTTWTSISGAETTVGMGNPVEIAQQTPSMRYVRAVAYIDGWSGTTDGSVTFWAVGYAIKTVM